MNFSTYQQLFVHRYSVVAFCVYVMHIGWLQHLHLLLQFIFHVQNIDSLQTSSCLAIMNTTN